MIRIQKWYRKLSFKTIATFIRSYYPPNVISYNKWVFSYRLKRPPWCLFSLFSISLFSPDLFFPIRLFLGILNFYSEKQLAQWIFIQKNVDLNLKIFTSTSQWRRGMFFSDETKSAATTSESFPIVLLLNLFYLGRCDENERPHSRNLLAIQKIV